MPMHGATQKERRSNLRVVRRILSQWKKVRRSHLRAAKKASQANDSYARDSPGQPSYGLPAKRQRRKVRRRRTTVTT